MELIKLTCNSCGAPLEMDIDHLMAYCPHCGNKLAIGMDQFGTILAEREKTKRYEIKEEQETRRQELKMENERKDKKMEYIMFVFIFVALAAFDFILMYFVG